MERLQISNNIQPQPHKTIHLILSCIESVKQVQKTHWNIIFGL